MTGKGDRWGRDRIGRSAPAFLSANTIACPPTYLHDKRQDSFVAVVVCCKVGQLWAVCSLRPVPGGESAGCVRLQCLFCRLLFACHPLPAMPTALIKFLPPFILLSPFIFAVLCPCSCHVRQDRMFENQHVCKLLDCPVGSCNTGLQLRPVHWSIC